MKYVLLPVLLLLQTLIYAQKSRARDIGIPFDGQTGKYIAITDVQGVEVGHSTIISGQGKNILGQGPVRTGVTAILPRGKANGPVFANWYSLNGNGEMTGTTWITESGFLETPVMITNTNSVGVVRDAVLKWFVDKNWYKNESFWYTYPVVAETYDGFLNDIYGFHVKETHAWEALNTAARVPIGIAKVGGLGENGSGDIFIAFSTANPSAFNRDNFTLVDQLPNDLINPLFEATAQAVEESIINTMTAAETMEGINGNKSYALPHQAVINILKKYKRIK